MIPCLHPFSLVSFSGSCWVALLQYQYLYEAMLGSLAGGGFIVSISFSEIFLTTTKLAEAGLGGAVQKQHSRRIIIPHE